MNSKQDLGIPIVMAVILLLPSTYAGSYFALVRTEPMPMKCGLGPWPRVAKYSMGGRRARSIYAPINRLDRWMRPNHWQEPGL